MNAITFLVKEHDKVRRILARLDKQPVSPAKKQKLFNLCQDLVIHESLEETVWYPQLKTDAGLKLTIKHLIAEEKEASKVIEKLTKMPANDEWEKTFKKFKAAVEHHANEEETKLFPQVKMAFDEAELRKLGREMRQFKKACSQYK